MSTKYAGEKLARQMMKDIFSLLLKNKYLTSSQLMKNLSAEYTEDAIRKSLYKYKNQKYLEGSAYDGYSLSDKGLQRLRQISFDELEQKEKWDKKWRIVIYDVPEEHRQARNSIRKLIKQLGFKQLQQSVWAHPLPCFDQFRQIRDAYGITEHLLLIEVAHSDEFKQLFINFKKLYPDL